MSPTMMLDHPAWLSADNGRARRAFRSRGSVWAMTCTSSTANTGHRVQVTRLLGEEGPPPVVDIFAPSRLGAPPEVGRPLRADGPVSRVRNPDLWDALATSIIRQVIRASQARKLYRSFCETHGEQFSTAAGPVALFPSPETVLALDDDSFANVGMAFKRPPLRAAAEAYLRHGEKWAEHPAPQLVGALQAVPRIGPWTAGATVADFTNDYSLYPFADLAVRTWAKRLAPSFAWPHEESEFAQAWQELAGEQLSRWTLLTLAWGVRHANGVAV